MYQQGDVAALLIVRMHIEGLYQTYQTIARIFSTVRCTMHAHAQWNPHYCTSICCRCRRGLEQLVDEGLVVSLGLSNCSLAQVEEILAAAKHKPVCNQVSSPVTYHRLQHAVCSCGLVVGCLISIWHCCVGPLGESIMAHQHPYSLNFVTVIQLCYGLCCWRLGACYSKQGLVWSRGIRIRRAAFCHCFHHIPPTGR